MPFYWVNTACGFYCSRSPPPPVRVEDFVNHVAELRRDSDYGFASEFAVLLDGC